MGKGSEMGQEERASTPRAGSSPDPARTQLSPGCAPVRAGRNRVSRLGPCPLRGHRLATNSQSSQPHHLSKGLDNKRRVGAEKRRRGDSKSSKSFRGRGCVLLTHPPPHNFCEFLEETLEPAPDAIRAPITHAAPQACIHTGHPGPGTRWHAQRLPFSSQTTRVTVQIEGNAAVPLRFPGRIRVPTGSRPLPLSLLPLALPAQVVPTRRSNKFSRAAPSDPGSPAYGDGGRWEKVGKGA